MTSDDLVIVLTAGLLATSCGLLGTFLVLRGRALLPDAVSHAVLPGIVGVYLVTGGRDTIAMLLGATLFGVVCVLAFQALRRSGIVASDAAIALVFPALFSLGVLGVSQYTSGVHLDLDSTIYGELTFAPLRTLDLGGTQVPRSLLITGAAAVVVLAVVVLFWRPLVLTSFDPEFAEATGIRVRLVERGLLVLVAAVAVTAFESIGAILVVTFFVVPSATAQLVARRLDSMLGIAVAVGWVSALLGQRAAVRLDSSVAGSIGLAAVGLFVVALVFAPRRGLLWRRRGRVPRDSPTRRSGTSAGPTARRG
ncbi:metal ABC transporter permease [Actinoalloteichus sp. AHMU CJ021]|uniref:metal ABC transporter permease n=1 Tax=Actinoalloteichus sp. AHMU CJ021 TaxID=2072503 RepID=UPI000CA02E8B|nr:metal ABC transporter permease [Actinoalloteichus sp. AHMU CJ021]